MRFNFVAKVECNGQDAKVPGFREINGKANGISMNLVAVAEQNNRAFMECAGFKNDVIKTFDNDNNKIEINWEDREDEDVIKKVANYRKNVIVLNGERREFVATLDFIQFIRDNIDEIKGKDFTITGQIQKNEYNGKISDRFQIQNMFEVTEEKKHQLRVYGDFFFNADGIDLADWKSERKITFNGYTKEYMNKEHPSAYVEKTITLDASKIDLTNEKHVALLAFRLKLMGVALDGENVKISLKKNTYYANNVVLGYVNGAEKIEFSADQLTDTQKEMVALGIKKPEDFAPAGAIYGNRVQLYKLVDFDLRGKYEDGMVKLDEKASEFEENIYSSVKEETVDDFEKKMNKPVEKKSDEDGDDDLFG